MSPSGTRDALVEAATALLEEGGPAAVTLREVGRRAGVSHNAPYKHFADKEALLAAVAARHLRRGRAPQGVGIEAVTASLQGFVRQALAHPELFKLTYGPWRTGSTELAAAVEASRSSFLAAVEAAQADGDLPAGDPERVGGLLLALARGAVDMALDGHLSPDGKGHATPGDLVDDLLAYLGAR
jgi:AcrR family transcriptional regulator